MPRKPSVFISHCSAEPPPARRFIKQILTLAGDAVDFVYDKFLLPGDRWHAELWQWWSKCDIAIIICSRPALKSHWMCVEAEILTRRAELYGPFPIFPVLIGVSTAQVQASNLGQHFRLDPQAILCHDDEAAERAGEEIARRLLDLTPLADDSFPLFDWEERLSVLLEPAAGTDQMYRAAVDFGVKIEAWMQPSLQTRLFARALLSCGNGAVIVNTMHHFAFRLEKDKREALMSLVSPARLPVAHVSPVRRIMKQKPGSRGVALAWSNPRMGEWYVARASATYPTWDTIAPPIPESGDFVTAFVDLVEDTLREAMSVQRGDPRPHLNWREQKKRPVFLLIPVSRVDEAGMVHVEMLTKILDELSRKFPTLAFFVLAGEEPVRMPDLERAERMSFLEIDQELCREIDLHHGLAISGLAAEP